MTFRAGITISKSGAEHERKGNRNGAGLDRHGSAPASCEPLIRGAWGAGAPSAKLVKLDCKWTRSAAGPAETQVSDGAIRPAQARVIVSQFQGPLIAAVARALFSRCSGSTESRT